MSRPDKALSTKTLCPYCGVGCGLEVFPPARKGRGITRDSEGRTDLAGGGRSESILLAKGRCASRGLQWANLSIKIGFKHPMMRHSLDQPFEQVTWEAALSTITSEIQKSVELRAQILFACMALGSFKLKIIMSRKS